MSAPDDSQSGASPEWHLDDRPGEAARRQEDERDASRERERRALQLAAEAQALPVAEQAHFLARACGVDSALRRATDALMARINEDGANDGFLSEPAIAFAEPLVRAVEVTDEHARAAAMAAVRRAVAGRFDLGAEVGRGGCAVVYRARDLRHHRDVAVKIVACDDAGSFGSQRFTHEIEIAARLQHPYIVPLLDSGRTEGALFYVMPFIEGETLRQRLEREGMLPLDDALAIARDVAEALDAAHAVGVVHRDVKPSNILLQQSHAVVADFGIALTLESSATRMTATGMVVGTPYYMSPEQAAGELRIDARSDVYSLGCVVYEMLAGEVPFPGGGAQAVRAKHLHAAVPDVTILRPTLPVAVQEVLARALAKAPTDRYPSAGALVTALRKAAAAAPTPVGLPALIRARRSSGAMARAWRRRPVRVVTAAGAIAIAAFAIARLPAWRPVPVIDQQTLVLFPLERHGDVPPALNEVERLRDAMREWRDLHLVDAFTLGEALDGADGARLSLTASQRLAASLGAGHFVRGSVSADRESTWLRVMLYRTDSTRMEGEASVRLPPSLAGVDSSFQRLVSELLFRPEIERLPRAVRLDRPGTQSYVAYRHFLRGQLAAASWDLAAADSSFARAAQTDRSYRQAWLWLGLTRRWALREPALWRGAAQQAGHGASPLGGRDSALAVALLASAEQDVPTACRTLRDLTTRFPDDFASWYASADCMGRDSVVVRDERSPTGWRFRSSRHMAIEHYRRAFLLMPSILRGLRPNGFAGARRLFQVSRSILANGIAEPPDTTPFFAFPVLAGDSLMHLAIPVAEYHRGTSRRSNMGPERRYVEFLSPRPGRATSLTPYAAARQRQRRIFREVAAAWVAEAHSAESYEALGLALQWLGDPAALDTLARARQLANTPLARANATATAIVAGLLLGAPDDTAMLHQAVSLADSLLSDETLVGADPRAAATIAAITGRAFTAARLAQAKPGDPSAGLPPRLRPATEGLFTFGAIGGPIDSLQRLEATVEALLRRDADDAPTQRQMALRRPAILALPRYRMGALATLDASRDPLVGAEQALLRGDTAAVRERLAYIQSTRRDLAQEDLTFDGVLPEAHVWRALREVPRAAAHLDPPLSALPRLSLGLADMAPAVALVRAMALRAELAAEMGDRATARRWARAITILWRDADPFLLQVVQQMLTLMS